MSRVQPFLRWVGGKARVASLLRQFVPALGPNNAYFEPFLGAGSLFFSVGPSRAMLSDTNECLIDTFARIKSSPENVWCFLHEFTQVRTAEGYYDLRERFNNSGSSDEKAALFIYLNKMCFNGIWRVNRTGQFNVPYGGKEKAGFPSLEQLRLCSKALRVATLEVCDFARALDHAKQGDFVYIDPPYLPISSTSFFRHYTAERFSADDHERVAVLFRELTSRGVNVMITEADSLVARGWYADSYVLNRAVTRYVASNGHRYEAAELLITNFRIPDAR